MSETLSTSKLSQKNSQIQTFCPAACWSYPNKTQLICHIIELYPVGMDSLTSGFVICYQFWGESILIFYLVNQIYRSRTQFWAKLHGWKLSDFLWLAYTQLIKSSNRARVLIQTRRSAWQLNGRRMYSSHFVLVDVCFRACQWALDLVFVQVLGFVLVAAIVCVPFERHF